MKNSKQQQTAETVPATEVGHASMVIGAMLRERRRALGLSMADVARASELSVGYISQLERDLSSPSLTVLMRIGEVLGMGMDAFLRTPRAGGHHFPKSARSPFRLQDGGMLFDRISGEFSGHAVNALVVDNRRTTCPARFPMPAKSLSMFWKATCAHRLVANAFSSVREIRFTCPRPRPTAGKTPSTCRPRCCGWAPRPSSAPTSAGPAKPTICTPTARLPASPTSKE